MDHDLVSEEDVDFWWSQHPELDREEVREILEIVEMYAESNDEAN